MSRATLAAAGNDRVVKNFGRALAAGAVLTGAITALNRRARNETPPENALHGAERSWQWRGHRVFATELGSGSPVILVHGVYAGASSYEFRKLFPLLAAHHRTIAFDLLGCGLSDRPNIAYSADLFTDQILAAIAEFSPAEPVTLVCSSMGAAFSIRAAARAAECVSNVIAICPTGLGGILDRPAVPAQRAVCNLFRAPIIGEALFNLLASRPSIAWFLGRTYADVASVTPEVLEHYRTVTHQEGARYVPAHFVGGLLNCNVESDLTAMRAALLVAWGERASEFSPLANAARFMKVRPNAELRTFADSGMLPHEEQPEEMNVAIESFLADRAAV